MIPIADLENYQVKVFTELLSRWNSFTDEIWDYYHKCRKLEIETVSHNTHKYHMVINTDANPPLIAFIKNIDFDGFLRAIISYEPRAKNHYHVSGIVKQIFGSYQNFEEFLESMKDVNSKYYREFMDFFKLFKETGFKNNLEFNFKKIPVQKR